MINSRFRKRAVLTLRQYPVYLVDDDDAVRNGLCVLFEAYDRKALAYASPVGFLRDVTSAKPGCLVLDLQMPHLTGLELQTELIGLGVRWPIVMITGHGDVDHCRAAFKSGVIDFLSKPVDSDLLFEALDKADRFLEALLEAEETEALLATLTPREHEIVNLICRGWGSREISMALDISVRTVDAHRANISDKLGTKSPAEFAQMLIIADRRS